MTKEEKMAKLIKVSALKKQYEEEEDKLKEELLEEISGTEEYCGYNFIKIEDKTTPSIKKERKDEALKEATKLWCLKVDVAKLYKKSTDTSMFDLKVTSYITLSQKKDDGKKKEF